MSKLFNTLCIWLSFILGGVIQFLGGYDKFLQGLIGMVIIDYLTGIIKALYNRKLSSEIGFKGILKKIMIFLVVASSVVAENVLGTEYPIREIVIIFYMSNEGISIIENASEFLPIPQKLKDLFLQLRKRGDYEEVNKIA